jgi:hypothetical protein
MNEVPARILAAGIRPGGSCHERMAIEDFTGSPRELDAPAKLKEDAIEITTVHAVEDAGSPDDPLVRVSCHVALLRNRRDGASPSEPQPAAPRVAVGPPPAPQRTAQESAEAADAHRCHAQMVAGRQGRRQAQLIENKRLIVIIYSRRIVLRISESARNRETEKKGNRKIEKEKRRKEMA